MHILEKIFFSHQTIGRYILEEPFVTLIFNLYGCISYGP